MTDDSPDTDSLFADLLRGASTYGISQVVSKALIFGLLPVYTYFLTPSQYGIVSLAETIGLFVGFVATGGLPGALQRLYFKYDGAKRRRHFVATLLKAGLALAVATLVVAQLAGGALFGEAIPWFSVAFWPFVALGIGVGVGREFQKYRLNLYQVQDEPRYYAAFQIGAGVLVAAATLYFVVVRRDGASGLLLGHCLGYGAVALAALWTFREWFDGETSERDSSDDDSSEMLGRSLAFGLPLVAQQFIAQVLVGADRFFLEYFGTLQEVGAYSIAYRLGMTITLINAALILAWKPDFFRLAEEDADHRQTLADTSVRLMAILTGFAVAGILVSEGFVYLVLADEYAAAGLLTPLVIVGHLFNGFYVFFHLAIYHSERTWLIASVTVLAAAANIGLNFLLVPLFGPTGAAYATIAAFVVEAAAVYAAAQFVFRLPYRRGRLLGIAAVAGGVCVVSQLPGPFEMRMIWLSVAGVGGLAALWRLGTIE